MKNKRFRLIVILLSLLAFNTFVFGATLLDVATPTPVSIEKLYPLLQVYEFDKNTLDENGWAEIPGGFTGAKPGTVAFKNFSADFIPSSKDNKGMALTVNPSEVAFVYAKAPIRTGGAPVMLRMTVRADGAEAAVALAALKGNMITQELLDGSIATHIPASAASFQNTERRIVLMFEPDQGDQVTPVIQVAATGKNAPVTVFVDRLEFFKLDTSFFGASGQIAPTPTLPSVAPTPTNTPTWTPTPVSVPSSQTITVSLTLPVGAKPLDMVLIPHGRFLMGSPNGEQGRDPNEGPQHWVTISKPFYMGTYEVTQAQYQAVMNSNPSYFRRDNNPVECVSWDDCEKFCNALSKKEGRTPVYNESTWEVNMNANGYRLPTEAEWEYACRAGTTTRFYWGDDPNYSQIGKYAWYWDNSSNQTHEVGTKLPNAWGLYDMSGNVYEWCQDWDGNYSSNAQNDPTGAVSGSYRVFRGGGWVDLAGYCRSADRGIDNPGYRNSSFGFRLTRTQDSQPNQIPTSVPTPPYIPTPHTPIPTATPTPTFTPTVIKLTPTSTPAKPPSIVKGKDYFPLKLNTYWTYTTKSGDLTNVYTTGKTNFYGTDAIVYEPNLMKEGFSSYFSLNSSAIEELGAVDPGDNSVWRYQPPIITLPTELEKGTTWVSGGNKISEKGEEYTYIEKCTIIEQFVPVTVPAGTFSDTLSFLVEYKEGSALSYFTQICWCARNVGLIKVEFPDYPEYNAELIYFGNSPMPEPKSTSTPTPTATPTPVSVPSGQTITVPLDLPAGAKPLEMVLIPAGMFLMGSPNSEMDRYDWEGPQHQVTLTKSFYMGKYEVTQEQWLAVMGSNPSLFKGNNLPVEAVSWNNCQTFISTLNQLGQGTFRLPTEAEWEYACRAGTTTRFYWGDDPNYTLIKDYAWYDGNNSPNGTKEVGLKQPNVYGLFDMSGNVWEWCGDWYGSYSSNDLVDPKGPNSGNYRVFRGGSWYNLARNCRSAFRLWGDPDGRGDSMGLRVARTQDSQPTQIPTPIPTPIATNTPIPTPTWTPTPVSVPSGQTITIPLDLPAGAKPLELVLIPAGTFTMGSPNSEQDRNSDEGPQHQVTLTKSFYMGKYEVTQAQYQAVMGGNPSYFGGKLNNPVEQVSWDDCQTFIQQLNQMGQGTFRLPTEAEWEYACRAGTTTRFYWGDDPNYTLIKDYEWYSGNSSSQTHEVGIKKPNAWGLFDMSGNVSEWCQDWYWSYSSNDQVDPIGQPSVWGCISRGGSWGTITWHCSCRSACRQAGWLNETFSSVGFRVVLMRTQ